MRKLVMLMALAALATGCGSVDDPPLGGPYGGTTNGTDPNGGQNPDQNNNNNNNSGTDAGSTTTTTKDSGTTQQQQTQDSGSQQQQQQTQDSGSQQQQQTNAPTWTSIYNNYLKSSVGRCNSCHSQCSSASNTYSWLQGKGYISGTSSALVDSNQSCLSWYGGNMPPSGGSNAAAVKDMNAWAAAGAANN